MRVGVVVPMGYSDGPGRMPSWDDVHAFALGAEEAGLDSVWVCDHFLSGGPGLPTEGIHEGWTILSALAASTSRVELGQLVMCVSFRNPALLAKMAVTADDVSGGRVLLGLGAGWFDPEYEAFGYPTDHRVARLEEALQIVCPLLDGETVAFEGQYHGVHDAALLPKPDRRIPVLVAGHGERMLRLTVRYADAWNTAWFREPNDRLRKILARFDAALDSEQRDPLTIRRTVGMDVDATRSADDLARALEAFDALGFDDVIVEIAPKTAESLERLAEARRLVG